jgi:hypothetical protein
MFRRNLESRTYQVIEILGHVFVVSCSAGVTLWVSFNEKVGTNSGIISCWTITSSAQWNYFYYFMAVSLLLGVFTSIIATRRLYEVLHSNGPEDEWTVENRPLRRVVYGNMVWTLGIVFTGAVPVVDSLTGGEQQLFCWLANISVTSVGCSFVVAFDVLPYYLEKFAERARETSVQSLKHAAGFGGGGGEPAYSPLFDQGRPDRPSYLDRSVSLTASSVAASTAVGASKASSFLSCRPSDEASAPSSKLSETSLASSLASSALPTLSEESVKTAKGFAVEESCIIPLVGNSVF